MDKEALESVAEHSFEEARNAIEVMNALANEAKAVGGIISEEISEKMEQYRKISLAAIDRYTRAVKELTGRP